jgi:hypothetical protein
MWIKCRDEKRTSDGISRDRDRILSRLGHSGASRRSSDHPHISFEQVIHRLSDEAVQSVQVYSNRCCKGCDMPRELKSLDDMINDIAFRKQRAAQARFGRGPTEGEAPKDVYSQSCAAIGQEFVGDGFRYSGSGPHFSRRVGDMVFKVSFQSSHNNIRGEYVALWIHVNVRSPKLKKWRITNQSLRGPYDFVAGGQIGILTNGRPWMEWNLADPAKRQSEIDRAVLTIRELAFPYFAVFEDPANICDRLKRGELIGMDLLNMFDFAACFSSLSAARDVAVRYLSRRLDFVDDYRKKMEQFRQKGLPDHVPSGTEALAALSIRFGLGDLASPTPS